MTLVLFFLHCLCLRLLLPITGHPKFAPTLPVKTSKIGTWIEACIASICLMQNILYQDYFHYCELYRTRTYPLYDQSCLRMLYLDYVMSFPCELHCHGISLPMEYNYMSKLAGCHMVCGCSQLKKSGWNQNSSPKI